MTDQPQLPADDQAPPEGFAHGQRAVEMAMLSEMFEGEEPRLLPPEELDRIGTIGPITLKGITEPKES